MSTLIVPACGLSTRFPDMKLKWLLTGPKGRLMIQESLQGITGRFDRKLFIVNKDIVELYGLDNLKEILSVYNGLEIVVLPLQTCSQTETIYDAIKQENIEGPIYIKDTDNYFEFEYRPGNYVNTYDLNLDDNINYVGKCFVTDTEHGMMLVEKQVVSSEFGCGGYSFAEASDFVKYYDKNPLGDYISNIINEMVRDKADFSCKPVKEYKDWGDLESWKKYRNQYRTLFIDLDGVLVENSGKYGDKRWGTTSGLRDNVRKIQELYESGKCQVIITTARPEAYRKITEEQLAREGISYHTLAMGFWHCKRIVINDYSNTNPYKSCSAVNIKRNGNLTELLQGEL